jgi:hypothetical protein
VAVCNHGGTTAVGFSMSLLDSIRIAEPCTEAWSAMTGDERARHCGKCDKTVFDLSQLTRAEAEALLIEKGANMCGRYFQRTDGTIVLADCLVRRKRRRVVTASVVAAAVLSGAAAVAMHDRDEEPAALGAVELPGDEIEASLPQRETQTVLESFSKEEPWRFTEHEGSMLGGAISFDVLEEVKLTRDAVEQVERLRVHEDHPVSSDD